jgi:hypothetical protein
MGEPPISRPRKRSALHDVFRPIRLSVGHVCINPPTRACPDRCRKNSDPGFFWPPQLAFLIKSVLKNIMIAFEVENVGSQFLSLQRGRLIPASPGGSVRNR